MAKLTLFFQNRVVDTYPIGDHPLLIGRAPESDIRIDSLSVAEQHARILPRGDRCEIVPEGQHTTVMINHRLLSGRETLHHGDVIQISRHTLSFNEPEPEIAFLPATAVERAMHATAPAASNNGPERQPAPAAPLSFGCVQVVSGRHIGKTIALDRPLMRLGLTGNECAIIARRHDGYYITHLEGSDPLLLDGKSIGEQTLRLPDGALLCLGEIEMRFFNDLNRPRAAEA